MAYFAGNLVSGICLHSSGRKPCQPPETYPEHFGSLAAHRALARGQLEFCGMGAVLWSDPSGGKISAGPVDRAASGSYTASVQPVSDHDRMGILFQSVAFVGFRLSGGYVRKRRAACGRFRESLSAAVQSAADADSGRLRHSRRQAPVRKGFRKKGLAADRVSVLYIRAAAVSVHRPSGDRDL